MILHLLYIIAFTILAFLAMGNLIRNLMTLGMEAQRPNWPNGKTPNYDPSSPTNPASRMRRTPHPELLDENGKVINEPLLVMRSMTVEDARERLDALYDSSPSGEPREDS